VDENIAAGQGSARLARLMRTSATSVKGPFTYEMMSPRSHTQKYTTEDIGLTAWFSSSPTAFYRGKTRKAARCGEARFARLLTARYILRYFLIGVICDDFNIETLFYWKERFGGTSIQFLQPVNWSGSEICRNSGRITVVFSAF
jgi:hypothetical protein